MSAALVTIGNVVKPHGLAGEVVVRSLTDVVDRFHPGSEVVVAGVPTTVVTVRAHQDRLLVGLAHVTDRDAAERLRGAEIRAEPLDPDGHETYFVHELVGSAVVDDHGADLGRVRAALELPGAAEYDLLEVERPDGGTWLLPAVEEYVEVEIVGAGVLRLRVVSPPAGLLDEARGSPPLDGGTPR